MPNMPGSSNSAALPRAAGLALLAAAALPNLVALTRPPSVHMMRELTAFFLWGLAVAAVGVCAAGVRVPWRALRPLLLLLALLAAGVGITWLTLQTGAGPKLAALAFLGGAALVACAGGMVARTPQAQTWLTWLFAGWLLAGILNSFIGVLQVYQPEWTGSHFIAAARTPGRAGGNNFQSNHLATNLLWALVALAALVAMRRLRSTWAIAVLPVLCGGLALSGSRMGLAGLLGLAIWGALARAMPHAARGLLIAAPFVYGLAMLLIAKLPASASGHAGLATIVRQGDVSSSRFQVWEQAFEIAKQQPLVGAGFGEFNTAWTLTPLASRHPKHWDHAHNLFVQWLVEFGWPLALLLSAMLLWAAVAACRQVAARAGGASAAGPFLLAVLALVGVHSQLEFPLWYPQFLLPTAFVWGFALGLPGRTEVALERHVPALRPVLLAGLVLALGAVLAFGDFVRAFQLAYAVDRGLPLQQPLAKARSSVLFAAYANWVDATERQAGSEVAKQARHHLIDRKLMAAWAAALAREGHHAQALHVAQRLREFCAADASLQPKACERSAEFNAVPAGGDATGVLDWHSLR